jgi:hypothetical protein
MISYMISYMIMTIYMTSLQKYDIIHDIILYIRDMACIYICVCDIIYDITMLPNIMYDIMKVS